MTFDQTCTSVPAVPAAPGTETLPEPAADADQTHQADVRHVVRAALAGLSPQQRAVVVLRYVEDLSEAQTAAALGCSVGTVKSQTSRAVARLRTQPGLEAFFAGRDEQGDAR